MDYMRNHGSRMITVNKSNLISKIKENKKAHEKAYKKAVTAYKKEALKQLRDLTKDAKGGDLEIGLNLTTPINNTKNYDKIIEMFNWEEKNEVELEQKEFNEYVQDETEFARQALYSNSMYLGG